MTRTILIIVLYLLQQSVIAQTPSKEAAIAIPDNLTYSSTGISTYIKEHYQTDTARVRAIFNWVANNINYDIERFQRKDQIPQPVADILKSRLAVCAGYSDLFAELCKQCNINCTVIGGYTRQKGNISNFSHAWVATELDHKWWMFDPTWAAGYVKDNHFTKGYSTTYYKLTPDVMIKDHMPFDPMYEFLDRPITNRDFIEGRSTASIAGSIFNYSDTLQKFNLLSNEDKIKSQQRRVKSNGIETEVINQYYLVLNKNTESISSKDVFEQAMNLYKHSVSLFNDYIAQKNKHFASVEAKDVKTMVDSISYHINASYSMLGSAVARDEVNRQAIRNAYQELERFSNRINQEKEFVTAYVNADENTRKQMFYRKAVAVCSRKCSATQLVGCTAF